MVYSELWEKCLRHTHSQALSQLHTNYNSSITIDVDAIGSLWEPLVEDPVRTIGFIRGAIKSLDYEPKPAKYREVVSEYGVKFIHVPGNYKVNQMNIERLGKFCSIHGIVRWISGVEARVTVGKFNCVDCQHSETVVQVDEHAIKEPVKCPSCNKKVKWELDREHSKMINVQRFILQDTSEGLSGGTTPATLEVEVYGDECDLIVSGSRVRVNGVLKTYRPDPKLPDLTKFFKATNVEREDSEYSEVKIIDEDEKKIIELSHSPCILDLFTQSVATSIYGHDNIKRALVLQLFGGVSRENKEDGTRSRGDIHILMVGDPGLGKSQMMSSVASVCPRKVITSGKGSTIAGLTAAAVQDSSGKWGIDAGAMVQADRGQLFMDEIDKMDKNCTDAIHTAMEQQFVSIHKANCHGDYQCRCSILAAANPEGGSYDLDKDLGDQIGHTKALISRFDLVFVMLAEYSEEVIRATSRHKRVVHEPPIDTSLFRKYIAYAKKINPVNTDESADIIEAYYVPIRMQGSSRKAVPITERTHDALRRLSEASARMRLSEVVEEQDANNAIAIMDGFLKGLAYDAKLGQMDYGKLLGTGATKKLNAEALLSRIRMVCDENGGEASLSNIQQAVPGVSPHLLDTIIRTLHDPPNSRIYLSLNKRDTYRVS